MTLLFLISDVLDICAFNDVSYFSFLLDEKQSFPLFVKNYEQIYKIQNYFAKAVPHTFLLDANMGIAQLA